MDWCYRPVQDLAGKAIRRRIRACPGAVAGLGPLRPIAIMTCFYQC